MTGRTSEQAVVAVLHGGLQILSELLWERRATTSELARLTQRTEPDTRNLLTRMVERGWVEARGEGKGRTWHLSASVHRLLESSAGYVRLRGFEPLQQEQMILSFVSAPGRIARRQAAYLCAVTPEQAGRILRRLVRGGKLRQRGERRATTYYELP